MRSGTWQVICIHHVTFMTFCRVTEWAMNIGKNKDNCGACGELCVKLQIICKSVHRIAPLVAIGWPDWARTNKGTGSKRAGTQRVLSLTLGTPCSPLCVCVRVCVHVPASAYKMNVYTKFMIIYIFSAFLTKNSCLHYFTSTPPPF